MEGDQSSFMSRCYKGRARCFTLQSAPLPLAADQTQPDQTAEVQRARLLLTGSGVRRQTLTRKARSTYKKRPNREVRDYKLEDAEGGGGEETGEC